MMSSTDCTRGFLGVVGAGRAAAILPAFQPGGVPREPVICMLGAKREALCALRLPSAGETGGREFWLKCGNVWD